MDACRGLLSPAPSPVLPRTQLRALSSSSVPMIFDQPSQSITPSPTVQVTHNFTGSALLREKRDDLRTKIMLATPDKLLAEARQPCSEEREKQEFDQYLRYLECRLLYQPSLGYPYTPYDKDKHSLPVSMEPDENNTCISGDGHTMLVEDDSDSIKPADVLALATKAMIASKKAASLVEQSNISEIEFEKSFPGFDQESTNDTFIKEKVAIRSGRLLERRSKIRKVSKNPEFFDYDGVGTTTRATNRIKKIDRGHDPNDPLRLFLLGPETKQLLTVKEEKELFAHTQDLMRLEEVKERLRSQSDREPTLIEWAEAVGLSCQVLQSSLSLGRRSRNKMINANLRLVVHVARQYEGKGLNIQDLLQEGSRGLMRSLEKFKPNAGCRFPSYAYWWIRQSIRKAIFQNSRTIRLPENVFAVLKSIKTARRLCIQEGLVPTHEEVAKRAGITVPKLESLLLNSRNPVSIQQRPWFDQDVTLQFVLGLFCRGNFFSSYEVHQTPKC
ncbi:RNA polymerase sigma factor sigF, chloroplastic [Canna indica]|uniref:RNA polymerase sigma factor sigF, chloroplastic n=1 Tax=Canna indica TaxID=4628 RepID=A0AAQ3QGY5_9LILI|nr:RNA polymerase sigma factor sigF, chloroplastic [Canna indica]